ncbi:copper homeostasis membrane protein CopD [Altererythrobacter sp. Root672]|uniref:copper homeostasis membrane protein CopD n=1 Tax=Altererythrobacter sp. Root672 TaxID=1736584 RepID=UPI0006FF0693|nr:copper homeostasis membrane protein CopD [Altererythrobacter sp. Root672]KRA81249.1 hypothetical protein ASD76_11740 [Altererythrobacter sp. Root672]
MDYVPVIVIRFALYAGLLALAGLTAFSLYALTPQERASGILPLEKPALALSLIGLLLSWVGMFALVASMTGSSLLAIDGAVLREVVSETAIGTAWIVRMAAMTAAVASAVALGWKPRAARLFLLVSVSVAIATLVWTGHAGATEGWTGTAHRVSDIVHMLAAATWIGGLAAFAWLLFPSMATPSEARLVTSHRALEQFARVGTIAVGLILATGIVNSLVLLGLADLGQLMGSPYGQLLLAKLGLFAAMLILAAANRWRLTPALGEAIRTRDVAAAVRDLRKSLALEGAASVGILGLVAWLGTLEPPGPMA